MESLNPKAKDNNDDNEFATTPPKATLAGVPSPNNGSADKAPERSRIATASIPTSLIPTSRISPLIGKAGTQIQRLGEALCRIGGKVERLSERYMSSKDR